MCAFQFQISSTDQLSKAICNACYESVTKFYFHYEIVKTAQKNQHQFLMMQLTMVRLPAFPSVRFGLSAHFCVCLQAKPKTETNDDDSDVEFVSVSSQPSSKKDESKSVSNGSEKNRTVGATAANAARTTDEKRSSTSITVKNINSKSVISPRPTPPTRCVPVLAKRILNAVPKPSPEPIASDASAQAPVTLRTVNVVTRQHDGTVILRKLQMAPKPNVVVKRPAGNQPTKNMKSDAVAGNEFPVKRMKIDAPPVKLPLRPSEQDPKRRPLAKPSAISSSHLAPVPMRPKPAVIKRGATQERRTLHADRVQSSDAEKMVTMTPLSASEHQYAKRTTENDVIASDTEKPSPQTPLSATEHHYSKRNSDGGVVPTATRNRWRPSATATVVATAADSTRTDEIKSTTTAPSTSPLLLNEVLRRIQKPSIRVRSVQSLNNNAKKG